MDHRQFLMLAIALVAMVFPAVPAEAASQPFYAIVGNETPAADGPVWVRYYTAEMAKVNPSGSNNCKGTWDPPYCEVPHTNKPSKNRVGYLGYLEDIFNYDGVEGNVYHAVWDTEFGAGTPEHRGYYAWNAREVWVGEMSDPWVPSCAGDAVPRSCLGNSDPDFASGHEIEGTGLGTLYPHGGLLPMPVPRGTRVENGEMRVEWERAEGTGIAGEDPWEAEYDLYYVKTEMSCDLPTADQFHFLKHVRGTWTYITNEDVGIEWGSWDHFFLVLKIVYPDAGGEKITSRYYSADSTCLSFWGNAAEVVNLRARWLRRNLVEVSWETSLEDGVVGFYVRRAFTPDGPFERVSDLVPANGEPSKYTFIDTVTASGRVAASGLYYEVEAIDGNEGQKVFGPTRAEVPAGGRRKIRIDRGFRF